MREYCVPDLSLPKEHIHKKEYNRYKDIITFLKSHPLHYALTAIPPLYPDMLLDFWDNCEYHPSGNYTSGSVCEGKYYIRVTIKGLRDALRLPHYKEFDLQVSDSEAKKTLQIIWYGKLGMRRSKLPAMWRYLLGILMISFSGLINRKSKPGPMELQIYHSFVTGTNIDYAELIFNELKKKVYEQPRDKGVLYARFLSLVFQKTMGNNYTQANDVYFITPQLVKKNIIHYEVEYGHPKLTSAMRRTIQNPYEHLQPHFETDSSSSEANSADSEPGSSSHCKSMSPTLGCMSKVIPAKTNPTPPPPPETSETSSSQLSKSPSRNKLTPSKVIATTATLEAIADMDIDNHEPEPDAYFTPSPSNNHHSSPDTTQHDPPTDTSVILRAILSLSSKVDAMNSKQQDHQTNTDIILQAIMALTCKVNVMNSELENIKSYMTTLQTNTTTQQELHEQELTPLNAPNQSHLTSVQGLTSQVSALESEMKAVHHTLRTLQDNAVTSDAKLTEDIDAIKTQHFCFSVQLENCKNLQEKVHTTALNTQTAVNNLNDLCVAVKTRLGNLSDAFLANAANSNKNHESLKAKLEAAQAGFGMVQTTVGINKHSLGILNEQVSKLVNASTYQESGVLISSDEDDSKMTLKLKRRRG